MELGGRKGGSCGLFERIYESFPTPILGNHFHRLHQGIANHGLEPGSRAPNPLSIYASFMSFDQWDANSYGGNSHLVQV